MKKSYDVVIVGAGAAGCALARRLRRDRADLSVALVEQGSATPRTRWPLAMRVPALQPFITASRRSRTNFTQSYAGEQEEALASRALTYTRGKGLGGSTCFNDMTYLRGTRQDVASWQAPADTWTFDTLLPHFLALEHNQRGRSVHHNDEGPLACSDVQRSNRDSSLNVRFFEACESAGINPTDDLNGGDADGYTTFQSLVHEGERVDVYDALLGSLSGSLSQKAASAVSRGVFDVIPDATVSRILFSGPRATGVDLQLAGRATARVEGGIVVCCAGALGSPALLMKSGVGASGTAAEIPGVGQNLIQGTSVDLIFRIQNYVDVYSKSLSWRNARYVRQQWREFKEERTGIFTSFAEAVAYVRSDPSRAFPNVSLRLFRTPQVGAQGFKRAGILDGFTMRVTHHYPQSRGTVSVDKQSGAVRVRSNMLTVKEDIHSLDEGIQLAGLLTSSELKSVYYTDKRGNAVGPFWSYNPVVYHPKQGLQTQRDTAAFLAHFAEGTHDIFGTCAMGTVVDASLKVKGLEGLMVSDASVVPTPTMASSSVLGAAIADRAATLI